MINAHSSPLLVLASFRICLRPGEFVDEARISLDDVGEGRAPVKPVAQAEFFQVNFRQLSTSCIRRWPDSLRASRGLPARSHGTE
jgi:hypothetical protein